MLAARARLPGPATARSPCAPTRRPPSVLLARAAAASTADASTADVVHPTPRAGDSAAPLFARLSALGPVALDAANDNNDAPIADLSALLRPASPSERVALIALSHFGDLTSFELAQRLARRVLPALDARAPRPPPSLARAVPTTSSSAQSPQPTVRFVVVGLGSPSAARIFARDTGLADAARAEGAPSVQLLATTSASPLYRRALGFEPGFAPDQAQVSPYAKLLVMLAGLGSDRGATIREVFRGYVGDRQSDAVFFDKEWTPFDVLGKGYQRPFELATQRLFNMGAVLGKWGDLAPSAEGEAGLMLTQQGGALVLGVGSDGEAEVLFSHRDAGILCYVDTDALTASLLL